MWGSPTTFLDSSGRNKTRQFQTPGKDSLQPVVAGKDAGGASCLTRKDSQEGPESAAGSSKVGSLCGAVVIYNSKWITAFR
jgi:hypothetical protein